MPHAVVLVSDEALRNALGPALGAAGWEVTLCGGPEDVLQAMRTFQDVAAAVIENPCAAPGIGELVRHVRSAPGGDGLVIVAAAVSPAAAREALDAGVDDVWDVHSSLDLGGRIAVARRRRQPAATGQEASSTPVPLAWEWDSDGKSVALSPDWLSFFGFAVGEGPRTTEAWLGLLPTTERDRFQQALRNHLEGLTGSLQVEHRVRHRNGSLRSVVTEGMRRAGTVRSVLDMHTIDRTVSLGHDPLTGLPRREPLISRLRASLNRQIQRKDRRFALLVAGLDRFRMIHDSYGPEAAEAVLVSVAGILLEIAGPMDFVARLEGDNFAMLLENLAEETEAASVANVLAERLRALPVQGGRGVFVTASVGVVCSSPDHTQVEQVLRAADLAMVQSKSGGRGGFTVFQRGMEEKATRRLELESELGNALERNQLELHYQPMFSQQGTVVSGFEALLRWRHPKFGLVSPLEFLPIAEDTGEIHAIGAWILRTCCGQLARWQQQFPRLAHAYMSANLSAVQLTRPDLLERHLDDALKETRLPAKSLTVEVTEGVLIRDPVEALRVIGAVKARGVSVSIDDFGTGYSSLSYLVKFPADVLKVDKSFVDMLGREAAGEQVVRIILDLARSLSLRVVAEGVETKEQQAILTKLGCNTIQGYLYAKPMPAREVENLIAR